MNPIPFLYAAYIITGVIHAAYLLTLFARYQKLKRDMQELERKS